ncbi:Nucleolin, putative [Perkinsus marinus ATCC 50983]|uniref:Nucleolin, putative n=1 Tax=Perkinsus marinus (strain ATCC 50983 / TXsc) TaxID=423536 RepID=C5M0M9_PERM5|nr:Nucleolin, putative [Perkinsus marinus ATCC 50983]EEQ97387.1 Nucleolin, putative [Perkinsus marinus ATCC 50983]|eukprot:XP_002764670.1 Nucleolin, putative [Perkinsus marinus ATCC 50983]
MAPPRDQQSNRRAVRLSGRTSEEGSSRSPTSKRSREEDKDEDQHTSTRSRRHQSGDSRIGVTLTPAATPSLLGQDRKRRTSSSSSREAISNEEYDDGSGDSRRHIRPRRAVLKDSQEEDRDREEEGPRDGQSWYKQGSGDDKGDREGDKRPKHSGGIHASYEAHIDHRGSHGDGQRIEEESRRGRRQRDRSRHPSREGSRWYDDRDAAESPRRARSRDGRRDDLDASTAHSHRYHRSRGREDPNDDDGEEWYATGKSRVITIATPWLISHYCAQVGVKEGRLRVWVGSLPNAISDDEFYDIMSRYGEVEGMKLVALKGFAYVKYRDEESADAAVKILNGEVLDIAGDKSEHVGLKTKVDYVEDMEYLHHPYKPSMDKKPDIVHTLFVGNLPVEVTEQDIRQFFERDPSISIEQVALRRGSYKQMCYAHIRFAGDDDAEKVVAEFAGDKIIGRNRVRLDWAQDKHMQVKKNEYLRGATPRIYIGNLHDGMSEDAIRDALQEAFGTVVAMKLHRDRNGALAYGYVTFEDNHTAERAVDEIPNIRIANSSIRADFAKLLEPRRTPPPPAAGARPNMVGQQPQLLGGGYGQQQGGEFDPSVASMYAAGGQPPPPPPPPFEGDNAYAPLNKSANRQERRYGSTTGSDRSPSIERDTNVSWTVPEEFLEAHDEDHPYCSDSDYYYGTPYIKDTTPRPLPSPATLTNERSRRRRTEERSPGRHH